MKKFSHLLIGLVVAALPLSSVQAENINIYGWQNWSYEFISAENAEADGDDQDYDRLSNNAANIGFMSHMDTGIPGLQVGFRCEQFTYWGRLNEYTNWCNRNSKISLRHERMGELMFGQWLLPHNEIVAQWIDPFYDAGADSHTSIMGNIGAHGALGLSGLSALFYNGSFEHSTDFTSDYGSMTFNRRQEGVVQYVWPNTSDMASQTREGFQFRAAITEGSETSGRSPHDNARDLDPRIFSTGASYQMNTANGGQLWFAATYEQHEDISATDMNASIKELNAAGAVRADDDALPWNRTCGDSEDDSYRLAARYTHNWGNGQSSMIGAMWETLEFEISECERTTAGANPTTYPTAPNGQRSIGIERDAWMFSGKHVFGNGFDFRFSYMNADEIECDSGTCTSAYEDESGADAYNLGLFYTMPAGTELRATYSEVQNDDNAQYDFGINGGGVIQGNDVSMFALGIVHWFD